MEEEGNGRRQQQHWEEPNPHTSTAIVQMPQHEEEEDDDDDEAVLLQQWPTVDGPLGVQQQQALKLARAFFYAGFFLLPWLWFVNCFYFWPILRHRRYLDPVVRPCKRTILQYFHKLRVRYGIRSISCQMAQLLFCEIQCSHENLL
ncbi:hypothetical protein O6H91_18G014500 [Diphasiastrum complanatum]|uniref:Uncharacterized protein n=1 Tax=Diphasiastrum complanatum TaxID=34168 RepID=A0ACC2AY96_DIPCM|nr:hypothetical protein O6H91_18G014500 [Diphasiastrum complanatum]